MSKSDDGFEDVEHLRVGESAGLKKFQGPARAGLRQPRALRASTDLASLS